MYAINSILIFIASFFFDAPVCHDSHDIELSFVEACADKDDHLRIDWKANHRLKWSDFQGEPDYENRRVAAVTSSLIQFSYYCCLLYTSDAADE